ncbi:MAG: hypothetical protein M3461_17850 [Pseudomonadota bacterium]|nr:hypothetical protein [Pseudomonadota bacterium]
MKIGDTVLRIDFSASDVAPGPGVVESLTVDEVLPPPSVSEDKRLEVLARVTEIAATSQYQQAMLERFLEELGRAFPNASRRTIVLIEDGELVPRVNWPPLSAQFSFTLARRAITTGRALMWKPSARVG